MTLRTISTIDGNEAVAHVAYHLSEVIAIYPITPSSAMGEWADAWSAKTRANIWGSVPSVIEMQSEAGVAGALHGALQTGALATSFTASQGLLLMIPNMYKIAGELTPFVLHIAARTLATQALSIFGDHSDVMAARSTGFAMLCSNSVQEAMDFALIAHTATLQSRVPFMHFFDGFRTSHEEAKVEMLSENDMRAMIPLDKVLEHRARGLSPEHPVLRGTAQNPDVHFQARETVNPFYAACPDMVQDAMDKFAQITGRQYHLFEYHGAPDAERIIVLMGSGAEAVQETVDYLVERDEKVGLLKVRLYRPLDVKRFMEALPATTKVLAVLDRTKEPGSIGEPLYQDCMTALHEGIDNGWGALKTMPRLVGGRYGISSKEFNPAMIKSIFEEMSKARPKNHFTIGIRDDVSHTSLDYDPDFSIEPNDVVRAIFYGLGSDGTVGANKNSIKIIGEHTDNYAQGYYVYDSKKSGAMTISHLRFGPRPIHSTYLVTRANFVACHQPIFLGRYEMLDALVPGGTFLLNAPFAPQEAWRHLPRDMQKQLREKNADFYVIDANAVAQQSGMGRRINTVMQVCFFALSGVLPREQAIEAIKDSIRRTYGNKGEEIVAKNLQAVDNALQHLHKVLLPDETFVETALNGAAKLTSPQMPEFVRDVLRPIMAGRGEGLPVSALPCDGTYPTATAQYEKRNLAQEIPVWDIDLCIQCGKCAMVCPHSAIRIKAYDEKQLHHAPLTFKSSDAKDRDWKGQKYTIQVAPEDCTGCSICVDVCPARSKQEPDFKALNMRAQAPLLEQERDNWDFFQSIPERDRSLIKLDSIRQQQVQKPLFEFSGACSSCGETPYLKLVSQLFGDRMVVANATGCSSIYGGNLPTTPWATDANGRGPAWCNSLFEDNAEFGLGFRLSIDKQTEYALELVSKLRDSIGEELADSLLNAFQKDDADIAQQRERVAQLKTKLQGNQSEEARQLLGLVDMLVKKSVWIIGGDGWAYDIGYGGLDHVLASGRNVNILVLDTEVYSNTGGQMSKSTPRAAVAKFAAGGKPAGKKDLGLLATSYGNVYVASVAMGARDEHTLKAFLEAEAYDGPSLIIAYSHCIAHGIDMAHGMQNQKAAVESGQWLLYRYHPDRAAAGQNPLQLDSRPPKIPVRDYLYKENRFNVLTKSQPERAEALLKQAQQDVDKRWRRYRALAEDHVVANEALT
jgi:pyruvate-ferredoxin/flavodoxin oxidoreductase